VKQLPVWESTRNSSTATIRTRFSASLSEFHRPLFLMLFAFYKLHKVDLQQCNGPRNEFPGQKPTNSPPTACHWSSTSIYVPSSGLLSQYLPVPIILYFLGRRFTAGNTELMLHISSRYLCFDYDTCQCSLSLLPKWYGYIGGHERCT
jgi:hypothetical protein